ncbi:MAG: Pilus assembly protein CpaC [Hyphomicrobiales bacterium]|nr:Pilus assembly protein CpaC [Hyphomicrobiales bacterium]
MHEGWGQMAQVHSTKARPARATRVLAALALMAGLAGALDSVNSAQAQSGARDGRLGRSTIAVNHSSVVRLPDVYGDILVGSADVADVLPLSDRSIYVLGKRIGTTNVSVFDADKRLMGVLDVEVTPNLEFVQSRIRAAAPGARNVRVTYSDGNLVLIGTVPDAPTAERAMAIATAFSRALVVNALQVASPQQVLLEVRVIEASRNAGRELGIRWEGSGEGSSGYNSQIGLRRLLSGSTPFGTIFTNFLRTSGVNIDVVIQALEDKGMVRRLANPNLTALSGSTANFLAGGEFPVPVSSDGNALGVSQVTVVFKRFGIMLEFTPTVLEGGTLNLRITPEVSELDYANAVRNQSITIPSIIVRRATTEIMLKTGQSFAIAGLMASTSRDEVAQMPWIGSIPVLGALFRSQSFQKKETELVIIVTAHLARPGAPGDKVASPLDRSLPANDVDFFLNGKFEIRKDYRHYVEQGVGLVGPYGHVLDPDPASGAAPVVSRY